MKDDRLGASSVSLKIKTLSWMDQDKQERRSVLLVTVILRFLDFSHSG